MVVHWFYKLGNQEIGPLTSQQLKQLADENRLNPGDPVRREMDERWVPASSVKGLFPEAKAIPVGGVVPVADGKIPVGEVKGFPVGSVKEMPVVAVVEENSIPVGKMSVGKMTVGKIPVGKIPVGKMSVGKIPVGKMSEESEEIEKSEKIEKKPSASNATGIDLGFATSDVSSLRPSGHRSGKGIAPAKNATVDKEANPLSKKDQQKQQFFILIYATCGILGLAVLVLGLVYSGIFNASQEKEVAEEKVAETETSRALAATQDVPEEDIFAVKKKSVENSEKSEGENAEEESKDSSKKVEKDSKNSDKKVEGFSDASKVQIRRGDVKLHLSKAVVDTLGGFTGKPTKSSASYLFMNLMVSNMSESRILDYPAWGVRSKAVVLKDNLGNQYRTVASQLLGGKVPGQVPNAIQVTGNISDVLVFTAPVPKAEYLLLELPSLDEDEEPYRFLIPETMFRAKPETKIERPQQEEAEEENSEEILPDASQIDQGDLKVRRTDELSLAVEELAEENENAPTEEIVTEESEPDPTPTEEDGLSEEQREMRKMMEENGLLDSGEEEEIPDLEVKLDPELEAQMKAMEKQQEAERKARLREKNKKSPPKKSRNE